MTRGWYTAISTPRTSCWTRTGRASRGSGFPAWLAWPVLPPRIWGRPGSWRRSRLWARTRGRRATSSAWVRCWCTRLVDKGRSGPGRVLCSCTGWSTARLTSAGCRVNCGRWWAGAWPSSRIAGRRRAIWWRSCRPLPRLLYLPWPLVLLCLLCLLWLLCLLRLHRFRRLRWRGWLRVSRGGARASILGAAGSGRGARRGSPPGWWPPAPRRSSC
jgi:hypothetical protein